MTERLTASSADIARAAALLATGRLVAFPTETVYGLGADATDPAATAGIYAAKGRPSFNPLIAHVADTEAALREGEFDAIALRLAKAFWPGPLTLVIPARKDGTVCDLARAGLASVALRVPSHATARALLAAFKKPVAAPSANRSGHVSPTLAAHVLDDLDGRIDAIVDDGQATLGLESTIVACDGGAAVLLRPGAISRGEIEAALGGPLADAARDDSNAPRAPGRLASHYAPTTPVRLDAAEVAAEEAVLNFGPSSLTGTGRARLARNLSPIGDLREAAANLYAQLRELDACGASCIAVAPIPAVGLGEAINDRLRRAEIR
jgi:L-threonylcarbamoyladenylate synthase